MRPPTLDDLRLAADALGLPLPDAGLAEYVPLVGGFVGQLDRLDALPDPVPELRWPRSPGRRAEDNENPLGAWYSRCEIRGADDGPLRGKRVAIKDNVLVAGVPMANGSALIDGYIPEIDATVVTRLLDAGAEIVGKAACEDLCLSGGSHTSVGGYVRNPHDPTRSCGGSSSGSAALVAAGECDLAIGGDQGGSIRLPSSLCGTYGIKPTHGLVPYTGAIPIDPTIDHLGPIGASVRDVATMLDVVAGEDGVDPRQRGLRVRPYAAALTDDVAGLRVGILTEGFGLPGAEAVDDIVRGAAETFAALGASVSEVSVPWHRDGGAATGPIVFTGMVRSVLLGGVVGSGWKGYYPTSLLDHVQSRKAAAAPDLSPNVLLMALNGWYVDAMGGGRYYAKAQNLAPVLTAAYDEALADVDLLLLPTTQVLAPPLPPPDAGIGERLLASFVNTMNTAQFDVTGHPAMSVPCGRVNGLPVGMMLVGRRWEDDVVLRAAHAFEQAGVYGDVVVRPTL